MIYGSVCSGIEAASVAWHPLGWRAAFLSEIEAFPRAVLSHHYPEVPLHGDFTTIAAGQYDPIDLLVGGTPCQSFSIAGLRGGLDDDRGNLALEYLRLADRLRPRWLVWENVPGVLSSNGGRDFGAILGGMVELGYGFAYRVLDAKYVGVPQQRRRVFIVAYLGDWRAACAVLFERHSLSGDSPPSAGETETVAALTAHGVGTCGADDNQGQAGHLVPEGHCRQIAPTLNAAFGSKLGLDNQHIDSGAGLFVASPTRVRRLTVTECERLQGFPDGYTDLAQESSFARSAGAEPVDPIRHQSGRLRCDAGTSGRGMRAMLRTDGAPGRGSLPLDEGGARDPLSPLQHQASGRRGHGLGDARLGLSGRPRRIADGPRYRALGNSMAVPVMSWIGRRIAQVEALTKSERFAT